MIIKTFRKHLPLVVFIFALIACSSDDDNITIVPDRDRTEQQLADKDSLEDYLRVKVCDNIKKILLHFNIVMVACFVASK